MKIEKLILQNIGVYVNKNTFDLQTDKPIILIGGMNGRGKTTFLESVLFALYGRRSLERSQNLEEYLHKISNVTGICAECYIEMHFSVQEQEKTTVYAVKRLWDIGKKKLLLKTQVYKNGQESLPLAENWDMFVEEILPQAIAPFFFFDGEKIADLAMAQNIANMQSSIVSLLGIDIIDQLISDLYAVSTSNQRQMKGNHFQSELETLDKQIEEKAEKLAETKLKWEQIQEAFKKLESERREMENEYAVAGGIYVESRKRFEQQKEQLQMQMEANQSQLLNLAAGDLPLKMVEPLLEEILAESELERNQQVLSIFVQYFPEFYREYSGGKKWNQDMQDFFSSVKNKAVKAKTVYDLDEETRERMREMPQILEEELAQSEDFITKGQELKKQCKEIDNYMAIQVEDEKVAALHQRLAENSYQSRELKAESKNVEAQQMELQDELENLRRLRKQLLGQVVKEQEETDDNLRIVSYAQQQIELLQVYKIRLQALKVDELAEQMTECFQKIIAKEGLIQKIDIDHKTLEFCYYNKNGQQVHYRMLSSGEKQILVIAMLWALGICSKSNFPLIIDTPLARLDSVHRLSLIENYFPKASEQVIILSTDQEITYSDYRALKKYVGKEYTLMYDEETMSSSIQAGYFGGKAV